MANGRDQIGTQSYRVEAAGPPSSGIKSCSFQEDTTQVSLAEVGPPQIAAGEIGTGKTGGTGVYSDQE